VGLTSAAPHRAKVCLMELRKRQLLLTILYNNNTGNNNIFIAVVCAFAVYCC